MNSYREALAFGRHELRGKVQPPKFRALRLEPLEDRHLLTVLIWDPHQSGGAKLGGAGTWTNGGAAVWYNPDTRADVVWNNANGDTAVFEGTAGTVAVDSGVSAGGIGFETSGYAIGGDAITLTANIDSGWANGEIRTNGATEVINAVLGGSVGLTKTGTGTLTLSAMSTYGGATAIQNGTLAIARGDDRLPTGTTVTLGDEQGDSGVLQLGDGTTSCSQSLADLYIDGDGSHNRVVGGGTATATLTLTAEDVDEYDGILGGPGTNQNNLALEMDGSGVLLLTEDNTYAGDTYLNDGATGAGDTYVNDDVTPTLDTDSAFGTGSIYLNGATFGGSGTVGNNIVVEDDSTIIAIDTLTLGGDISDPSGPVNLTLCNFHGTDCVLQLGGDNSGFTGTLTQSVDHNIAGYGSLTTELLKPSAGSSQANWDISDVLVSNIDPRVSTAPMIELGSLSGGGTLTNVVAKSTVTYQIGGNNQSSEFDGVAEDGDGDAAVALVKTGEAMLTLGGVNTYGGGTTVEAGILEAKNTGALPHYTTSGSVVVSIGATLGVNVGVTGEWSASDISTLLSSVALTSGRALGIDTTDGNFTLANAISGSLGITKLGANTLTLTGMNSFTGGTKLIDGVLSVSGDDALAPGPITLSGGTLLDLTVEGTLTLDGSISGSGTIDCTGLNQNSVLKLAGDNSSFGGELDVSSGTVYFDSVSAGSALATWGLDGGVLANDVSGTPTIALGTLSGSGGTLNNAMTGSTVTYQIGGNNQSTEFDGVIEDGADTVALTEVGTGTQTLGGENTYTGGTTITQGTLRGSGSSFGTGSITLANLPGWGATLSSNGTLANAIVAAAGTESTVNAYLSPLTLTGGFSGTGWIIHTGAQLNLAGDNGSFQGTFWQTGDDSLVTCFTSVSACSAIANWQIDSGVLESDIDGRATIQLGALSCAGTLENASGSAVTYEIGALGFSTTSCGTVIDGDGPVALKKEGGGTMTFTSTANGYSGGTTIDGGVFRVDSAGELPGYDTPGAVVVNHGGTVAVAVGAGRWTASNIATLLANATFSTGSAVGIDTTCGSFTYANAITGSLGVSKLGANSLTLTGTNTYTGATTVAEGTLRAKTTGQLDTAGGVVVDSGATLALNVGGSGEWTASDVSTLLGYATFNSGSILALDTSGGDFEYDNVIAGDLGLVKLGAHTLTLPQANTYAGGTNLVAGGLMIGNNASLGSGALTLGGGTLLTDSTLTLNIPIVAADSTTSYVDADGTLTLAGSISGAGRIDCTDSDENSVLNLGGDDGGFSGELDLGPGATYFTSASAGSSLATWVLDGGVLASNVLLNVSAAPSIALGSLSGSGTLTNLVTDSTVAYQIGGADQSTQFDGVVEDGAGVVALAKTANGSLTLAGTNTYRGGTTIDGGTLVAPISGALPGYDVSVEVTVRNGGTLAVDVGTGKWTAADLSALLTDAVFNGGSVLGLDTGGGDFEYDDAIGGNLSLSKLGSGTLVLTAANTYSGDTFIRNGTLVVAGGDDRLPTGTTLTLGDAANDTSGILQLGDGTANDQTLAALINDMDYQYDAGGDRVVGGGSGVATLTLNLPAGADCEFDGILGGSGTYQNNLALTMTGPGTEDLGAVNTYGGGTTLNAGVLQVWNAEALGSGSVTVGGGVLRNLATTGYHLYYVDPDGLGGTPSDGNDGSIHSPFATLQEAYSVAQPGDTIVMRGGTYHTADLGGCIFDTGGSPGLPLTIEAAPGEHPIIDLAAMEQWQQDANGCWYTDLPTDAPLAYVEIINGWAATPVSGDPVNGGPPLALTNPDVDYYQNGQLAFDLTWYDATNHRLWFRSNEIEPITDPNTECGVVTPGSSQGFQFFGASWIVIKGIQIQNGYIGIHIGSAGNLPADHETVEDCRITNMWDQGILMGGTYDQTSNNYIGGHYDEICNNYVDAIGGQLSNRGREWLYHDLYAVGEGFLIHDNFFGRALSGASVQLLCSNATMTSVFANNVCYGGQAFGVLVNGNDILLTGNVIISPTTIWRGSPPASAFTDDHHDGLDMDGAQNCSNIVVSGNYIEASHEGVDCEYWPSTPPTTVATMPGWMLAGNTIAGGESAGKYDAIFGMLPAEMGSNQWGGGSAFLLNLSGQTNLNYDDFLTWAQNHGYESLSTDMTTALVDPSVFDSQLDAGLSLSQAMALFRTYATGKVDGFAGCPAVAQSSTLGGTTTPNVNGTSPQAGNDAWSLTAGTTLVVDAAQGVLANDSDPDYEALTAMLVSQPKYGQLTLNSDGSFSYTPNENVCETDEFTYLASDGHGGTAMATVVLNIQLAPTVNVTDAGGAYNGAPFPATATLTTSGNTQVASLGGVSPTLAYYLGSLTTEQLATATALPGAPSAVGTYTVVASFGGSADYVAARSAPVIFTITPAAPQVVGVSVSGSAWTSSSLVGGYSIPLGSGAQLLPLPWANIDQIEVTFNENVLVDQTDLLLTGVNVPSYDVGGTFSYDPSTFTATWTLPQPIGPDKLMLTLNGDGSDPIRDAAGNRLDGEWTNPASTTDTGGSAYPSGNGVAGGDFDFRFNVLPGDATQDGTVEGYDLTTLLGSYNKSGETWADGDFTGDGTVDGYDLGVLLGNYTKTLPSGEPVAGSFPADVSFAAATAPTAVNSEATVPSQADVIPHVAMADNSMLEKPDVLAAALPTRPALVQSDAPSPPVSAAADRGLPFVVRPPASAAHSLGADGFSTAAGWPTKPLADVAGNTSLWDEAVPAANLSSSFVPGEKSTSTERTIQDRARTVFAGQARAHDAVLAWGFVAPLPSEVSWLSDAASARRSRHPASGLESLAEAVDNALAAYDYAPFDV